VPEVLPPLSFDEAIKHMPPKLCLVAYENERHTSLKAAIKTHAPQPINIWIGPEGGFEDLEVVCLMNKLAATPISLGPHVLRTETAGIVAISQLLCLWES